jgi:hypothetical protein
MAFIRFSLFLTIAFTIQVFAQTHTPTRFSPKSCLDASFKMKMEQKGPLFGLLKQEFIIDKKNCIVHITYKKYLPKEWIIDVCREPVHIKVTSATGVDVAKKEVGCTKKDSSKDTGNFCSQFFSLMDIIQDEGLIFAEGDRDNLQSAHGKTYCSYLLLKRYLLDSVVFSRYTETPDLFLEKKNTSDPEESTVPKEKKEVEVKEEGKEAKASGPLKSVTSNF